MVTVGILSILEDEPYKMTRKLWKLFERTYRSRGVQTFNHPNITFQAVKTTNLKELRKEFQKVVGEIEPFEIEVDGVGHFDKKVIYLSVKKTKNLARINKLANEFLRMYGELFESYYPDRWTPHITLAMEDLTETSFDQAWNRLANHKIEFRQTLHNICIVKQQRSAKIRIDKRYQL
jgi:2'-5' RNA ligase